MSNLPPLRPEDNLLALLDSIRRFVAEIERRGDRAEIQAVEDSLWDVTDRYAMLRNRRPTTGHLTPLVRHWNDA